MGRAPAGPNIQSISAPAVLRENDIMIQNERVRSVEKVAQGIGYTGIDAYSPW